MTIKKFNRNIDYGRIVDSAMRSIVRRVLKLVQERDNSLPGNHHFYITVDLHHPEVKMSDALKEKHGDKITIVIQHQFSGLVVERKFFDITLSFGGKDEPMHIPFDSIISFADPSCSFGLQFDDQHESEAEAMDEIELTIGDLDDEEEFVLELDEDILGDEEPSADIKTSKTDADAKKTGSKKEASKKPKSKKAKSKKDDNPKVISLDSFRKK